MATNNLSQEQKQYFENLKVRYEVTGEYSNSNVLYFILSKADLNRKILDGEWIWLKDHEFFTTMNILIEEERIREQTSFDDYKLYKFYISKYKIKGTLAHTINPSLMFILCKLDSDNLLTTADLDFLHFHKQTDTLEIVNEINEFAILKEKYFANDHKTLSLDSLLYSILKKIEKEQRLRDTDIDWLKNQNLLEALAIYQKQEDERIANFCQLKSKYNATQHQDSSPVSPLYLILQKLEKEQTLNESEINWLQDHDLKETLVIIQEIENKKEFASLKIKYKATDYKDSSPTCHLYRVLKNLESENLLNESDFKFLKKRNLVKTIDLVQEKHLEQIKDEYQIEQYSQEDKNWLKQQDFIGVKQIDENLKNKLKFALIKIKYKATIYENSSPDCHLYRVLKNLETQNKLNDSDLNYLKKYKLTQTLQIALDKYADYLMSKIEFNQVLNDTEVAWIKENGYQEQHFLILKNKYELSSNREKLLFDHLYEILQKLERGERLEPINITWLQDKNLFFEKIKTKYHLIEANFYQQEYKRTGNKWNLPNASSHWRGAEEPEKALKLTDDLDFEKIKENRLKSALLTTRGGAFRDLGKLNEAEKCALKAIEYLPQNYHPYTLMGAICYERGNYSKGDYWFEEARKRGYLPENEEAEIKRIFNKAKDESKLKLAEYLKNRYSWAKKYLSSLKNKRKSPKP